MDVRLHRRRGNLRPLVAMACVALGGCGRDDFPNLAIRPEERATGSFAAPTAPAPGVQPAAQPDDAGLAGRLAALVTRAQAGNRAFEQARPGTEALVNAAAGAPTGSDGWARAQQALARLSVARGPTGGALTAIEHISDDDRVAHAIADGNAGSSLARADGAAISAAHDQVLALAEAQQAVLDALTARLAY